MRPARHLRPFVTSYVDFDMASWPPGRHRGLPDGTLPLVISTGGPLLVRRAGHPDVAAAATVGGLSSGPVDIIHDRTQRGVQLQLTPRGARALLGMPAAELAGLAWPLNDVIGRRADELASQIAAAATPAERAAALDSVLTRWAADAGSFPAAVDAAWQLLTASGGRAPIAAVAARIGVSRRHLGHLVRAELGLAPKTAARILRFSQAGRTLRSGATTSLAEIAVLCGYFDQAHLSNDWKQLGGCTPRQWMREELPFLQDLPAGSGTY